MRLSSIDGEAAALPEGMVAHQDYKGIVLPTFYCARLAMPSGAEYRALGTAGPAKIFGERRSLAGRFGEIVMDLVHAHIW
jgi:hypothetical protein